MKVRVTDESKEEAFTFLASTLYEAMERLDPPTEIEAPIPKWSDLDGRSREFYVSCVEALMVERSAVLLALGNL